MHIKKIYLPLVALAILVIGSCVKKSNDLLDRNEQYNLFERNGQAQVKFIHAYTPTTINGLATSTNGFRLLANGVKINGATNTSSSTNTLRYGELFPASLSFVFMPAGSNNFKFVMNRITSGNFAPISGDEVFDITANLTKGKKYSVFIADPYPAPGALVTEDNFIIPGIKSFGLRFVNVGGDVNSRYDLVSKVRGEKLFTNVGYKEMRDYKYIDLIPVSDTLYLTLTGTNTIVSTFNTFSPAPQRVYTFLARGKTGVTGRLPTLTVYTN